MIMNVDLLTIINNTEKEIVLEGGSSCTEADCVTNWKISGKAANFSVSIKVTGRVDAAVSTRCARCLKPIEESFSTDFTEMLKNVDEEIADKDAVVMFSGFTVDLTEIIRSNIYVNLSTKYLCSEDCKGICPVCGANMNESPCNCKNDYIDPRMEGLKRLLDKQEV